jgi:hypothetical protein
MEQLNSSVAKGAFPASYNIFEHDTLGKLAEIARARVKAIDFISTTRN